MHAGGSQLRQAPPVVYQQVDGVKREVRGRYVLHGDHRVGFALAGYDTTLPLVIDPVITYSTYLGGSGDDEPIWSDIDRAGNFYVTGITFSPDFPTTRGAFQPTFGGGDADAFVTKLNRSGSGLVWSTYLGGDGFDVAIGLDVDRRGNVVVTGETDSAGFPTTPGAFQPAFAGGPTDAFVTKLNAKGSKLLFSTFLGGEEAEGFDVGFISFFDRHGNVYGEGDTGSPDFPTTPGSFQPTFGGGPGDGFVAKLNPRGSRLVYSTFVGGSGADGAHDGELDKAGNFSIDGFTDSTDFPVTPGAFQPTYGGGEVDGWVAKLNKTGTALVYSTYLGGTGPDAAGSVRVNRDGVAHVPGITGSADFPVTPGAFQTENGGAFDVFLVKVDLGERHKGSGHQTASVTAQEGASSGPRAGLTRNRVGRLR
ncbi:MAG TPA: SBBP repeat-containing protein [Actinomycetota bacterium]|nr:SBBP repeat-containing protein [Actinomycetota bacterium]